MVLNTDHVVQADVIFVIESTAINGAYFQDIKSNYLIPALEYFSQGGIDDRDYGFETTSSLYGIVLYRAADCLPSPSCDTYGPYSNASRVLSTIDKIELVGGKGESHANIAEGLATALHCLEELGQKREPNVPSQRHCILICNSPPYMMHVMETHAFQGKTAEQLATLLQERGINLSIISPRKIPALFKLYEKAGGDLSSFQTKNYAKDPRHLVLLKGFSLKEHEISPPSGPMNTPQNQHVPTSMPPSSMPSPMSNTDTPMTAVGPPQTVQANLINQNVGPNAIFRPNQNPPGMQMPNQQAPHQLQMGGPMGGPGPGRPLMTPSGPQFGNQQMPGPPGYHQTPAGVAMGARPRWPMMPPQQRPPGQYPSGPQSALIAQLTQPPNAMGGNVGQFGQRIDVTNNPQLNQQQQVALRMQLLNQNPNVGPGGPGGGIPTSLPQQVVSQPPNQQQPQQQQVVPNAQQQQQGQPQQPQPGANVPVGPGGGPTGPGSVVSNVPGSSNVPVGAGGQQNPNVQQQQPGTGSQPPGANQQGQPVGTVRERHTIWKGILEWIEKAKPNDTEKIKRHVPCQVSANSKDGQPELTASTWPQKLIMQLMPKQLIGNIGGTYLKNSKSVLFHPDNCEALDSLTKVMSSGFAGCVHFTSSVSNTCDIKVLILLYTAEKRAYLGFIPNDQAAFVDRLRKVIQHQKTNQIIRQGQVGANTNQMNPGAPNQTMGQQGPNQNLGGPAGSPSTSQALGVVQNQSGMMVQSNPGQTPGQQSQQPTPGGGMMTGPGGQVGPNSGPCGPRMSMAGMPPGNNTQIQTNAGGPGIRPTNAQMLGGPQSQQQAQQQAQQQRQQFDHLARQQNLEKIMQLKQTLEQAQQQEAQYKSQLEIMSHMKTQQIQEALQVAQQQEMQYKQQMEQEQKNQLRVQLQQIQQQQQQQQQRGQMPQQMQQVGVGVPPGPRMMRPGPGPVLSNNPGLRHLLQQQPQYRPQMMNMQQMGGAGPRGPQMGQQMNPNQNKPNNQFDDVSGFDFM